jgi:hypothetical protein
VVDPELYGIVVHVQPPARVAAMTAKRIALLTLAAAKPSSSA